MTFEKSGFNLSSTPSPSFSLCSQTYSTHNDGKVFLSCDLSNANLSWLTGATYFVKLLYTAVLEIVDKKALEQTFQTCHCKLFTLTFEVTRFYLEASIGRGEGGRGGALVRLR